MKSLLYALINIAYFGTFCSIHGYSVVYLLDKGLTNEQIGVTLAIANVIAAVLQTVVAGIIDASERITNKMVIILAAGLSGVGTAILYFISGNKLFVAVIFIIVYMLQMLYQPLLTALYFEYSRYGQRIKFGLGRGCGSVGFAVSSLYLGTRLEKSGVNVLMMFNIVLVIALIIFMVLFTWGIETKATIDDAPKTKPKNNPVEFARRYPRFIIFLLGVIFIFFTHNMLNDFMVHVVRASGGSDAQLGVANFIQAFLELPSMVAIPYIIKKIKPEKILAFSATAFFIKVMIITLTQNMSVVYISQSFQMLAYAVFIPAVAYYINGIMDEADQTKGQAYVMCGITISGVLSNLTGGKILDVSGVKMMLIVGCLATVIGMAIELPVLLMKMKK